MAEFFDVARFEVDKRTDVSIPETYTEIGNVTMAGAEEGTYEYGFSLTWLFDQVNKSEFLRFSSDGGVIWHESNSELSDSAFEKRDAYQFYIPLSSGDLNLIVQVRKEDATGVMDVQFADTWIKRVA